MTGDRRGDGSPRARRLPFVVVAAMLAVMTACQASPAGVELLPVGTPGPPGTDRPRPGDTSDIDLGGQVVFYGGFQVKLLNGTFVPSTGGRRLVVTAEVTNTRDESSLFWGTFGIEDETGAEVGGGVVPDAPRVASGASVPGTIEFSLTRPIDRRRADLVMGRPSEVQARVPLGGNGPVVTLMPVDQPLPPPFSAGATRLIPTALTVRYAPVSALGAPAPRGRALLAVRLRGEGEGVLRYARVNEDGAQLTLPSGEQVPGSHFLVLEGERQWESWLVFTVPDPYAGHYRLEVAITRQGGTGSLEFDVNGPPPGQGAPPTSRPTARTSRS
jgi:hypothetical protein